MTIYFSTFFFFMIQRLTQQPNPIEIIQHHKSICQINIALLEVLPAADASG